MTPAPALPNADAALLAAFLGAIDHLTVRQAHRATGINYTQISLWRNGKWVHLTPRRRGEIERYLKRIRWRPRAKFTDEERKQLLALGEQLAAAVWAGERVRGAGIVDEMREVLG